MAKVILLGSYAGSLINFRGALLRALTNQGHDVIACAPGGDEGIVRRLAAIAVPYQPVYLSRTGINPAKDFFSLISLTRLFCRAKPDILLTYTVKPVIYGSLAARFAGVPNTFSMITGLGYAFSGEKIKHRLLSSLVRSLYRAALSHNQAVFFQNSDDQELFSKLKLIGKGVRSVLINGSGVDLDYFKPAPLDERPVFLLIARLIRDKGVFEYAGAARMLKQRYPEAVFRLVGWFDNNPEAISPKQIDQWQSEGIVEYLGETPDVRPFLAESNVYVLPSYREGTPRTVLEAMAMGRPIVTTDAPGCRETVIQGKNGFLVPPRNVDALVGAMERFITTPEIIETMGRESRRFAEAKYDVHQINYVIMRTMELINHT